VTKIFEGLFLKTTHVREYIYVVLVIWLAFVLPYYAPTNVEAKGGNQGSTLSVYNPLKAPITRAADLVHSYNNVLDIDVEGNFLWAATSAGIVRWNMSTKKYQKVGIKVEFPEETITSVTVDFNGNKWFGTKRGVVLFDGSKWKIFNKDNGLPANTENILCSTVDYEGNLWFGTRYGGVLRYNGKRWRAFSVRQGLPDSMIVNVAFDQKGNGWMSSLSGGVRHNGLDNQIFNFSTGFPSGHVNVIYPDVQRDTIWFGTINGLIGLRGEFLIKYTKRNGLPGNNIRAITVDPVSGDIWVGTLRGGVSVFNGTEWKTYNTVNTGRGLRKKREKRDKKFLIKRHRGEKEAIVNPSIGLPSNFINEIVLDNFGVKWFATSSGLCTYNDRKWTFLPVEQGSRKRRGRRHLKHPKKEKEKE